QQRPANAAALELRQDEEHAQEPDIAAHGGLSEADDAGVFRGCRRDPEAAWVGGEEVAEQADEGRHVAGEPRLVEAPDVVLDADRPDLRAGRQVFRSGWTVANLNPSCRPGLDMAGRQDAPSTAPTVVPVASRSSSAAMNASSSPS